MKNSPVAALSLPFSFTSHSPEETQQFARQLAQDFLHTSPDTHVLTLKGNLGAGKTLFSKAFISEAAALPMDAITSPTFVYVNSYSTSKGPLQHFDCYRLNTPEAFYEWGLEEPLDEAWLALVEWPEKIPSALPYPHLELHIEHVAFQKRQLTIKELVS